MWACLTCQSVIQLPMAGHTTEHSTTSRVRETVTSPRLTSGKAEPSLGEVEFEDLWLEHHPDYPFCYEYKFHLFREWRLDFAWPDVKVAVEVESSVHRTKGRFETDIPKYNALASEGWSLFRCTRNILEKDSHRFMQMVVKKIIERQG